MIIELLEATFFLVRLVVTFFTMHLLHEVVSRVAEVGALAPNLAEVVDSFRRQVEVDDLAPREKHQTIEHLKDVRVGLMDGAEEMASTGSGKNPNKK